MSNQTRNAPQHQLELLAKAVRDTEARHRQILNSATDYAIISLDLDGLVTSWNGGATRILGWSEADMLGQTVHRIFTAEDVAAGRIEQEQAAALKHGFAQNESWRVRRDGSRFWASGQMTPLRDDDGNMLGFVKVLRDRTEQHQSNLRQEVLELATEAAEVGTWDLDLSTQVLNWSARTKAMFGLPPDEPAHMDDFYAGLHPDDLDATREAFAQALDPGLRRVYDVEYRTIGRLDGAVRWVAARGKGIFDASGRCLRAVGTAIDITARKAAEARHSFLLTLSDRLRLTNDPHAIMATAVEAVALQLGVSRVGYARIHADQQTVTFEVDHVIAVDSLSGTRPLRTMGGGVVDKLRRGRTYIHADAASDAGNAEARLDEMQARGVIAVPLLRHGQIQAAFYAHHRAPRVWLPEDIALVEEVAARTWDAVERARAEQALREETRALETLNRIGTVLASNFDLSTLVQKVVDAGVELTGAQYGAFFYNVLDDSGASYMLYALAGAKPSEFGPGMPRATAVFAPTFRGEGVLRSGDITKDSRYGRSAPHHGLPKGHPPVRSYLAVPVTSRSGHVIGGLFFGHSDTDVFTDRSERVMAGLAAQAAISIDNARLLYDTQKANETLEARVEQRTRERDRVWELSEDLLVVATHDGHLMRVSPSWTRLLGHDPAELLRRPYLDVIHADDHDTVKKALAHMARQGRPVSFEARMVAQDGSWRWVAWTLSPEPSGDVIVGNGRDVTAERERQAQLQEAQDALRQAQKMEAVGQLTGGIAHDFNNLLQGITGSLSVIRRLVEQGRTGELDRFITGGMNSANRAAALTHRLLAFSRRQPLAPKPVQANPLVASMEDLLRRTLGERVQLELVLAHDLWTTLCDPNQLENAILNLCINARDAMPDGGLLTIETSNTQTRDFAAGTAADMRSAAYICISVTDTGTGMSPDTAAKAFDPFFTTKPQGQGTGLGLSMIYGFARQSEGHAKIISELGKGTTVELYLPRHVELPVHDEQAPDFTPLHQAEQGKTVLVIEDEPVVRGLIVDALNEMGYRTLEADDGPSGLKILLSEQPLDLLISDIGLPGLNGRQVVDAARLKRPDLKVLFMTGYAENAAAASGFLDRGMELMTKPFAMEALAQRVKTIIAR